MKVTIEIPENRYQKPTEVRQEVVQKVCTEITKRLRGDYVYDGKTLWADGMMISFNVDEPALHWSETGDVVQGKCHFEKDVQLRSVEMYAICEALQAAGYYITYQPNTRWGDTRLFITKTPFYKGVKVQGHFTWDIDIDIYDDCCTTEAKKRRGWSVRIWEAGKDSPIITSYVDANVDRKFVEDFFGCHQPDVVKYDIKEVFDGEEFYVFDD